MTVNELRTHILNATCSGDLPDDALATFDHMVDAAEALENLLDEIGLDDNDQYFITTHADNEPVTFARNALEKLK